MKRARWYEDYCRKIETTKTEAKNHPLRDEIAKYDGDPEELIEREYGLVPSRTEGVRDGRWAVIDYGDVIVHIFNDETRLFYHLERLWSDGENLQKYDDAKGDLVDNA